MLNKPRKKKGIIKKAKPEVKAWEPPKSVYVCRHITDLNNGQVAFKLEDLPFSDGVKIKVWVYKFEKVATYQMKRITKVVKIEE